MTTRGLAIWWTGFLVLMLFMILRPDAGIRASMFVAFMLWIALAGRIINSDWKW